MSLVEMENACVKLVSANITAVHFVVLCALSREEITMSKLSKVAHHTTAATTSLVDRLEKLGFVQRFRPIDDRRTVVAKITQAGLSKLKSVA